MKARIGIVGLTGGIATGKTTVAGHLILRGVPVFDADGAVHALYAPGGAAVAPVLERFPDAASQEGGIDREKLAAALRAHPDGFKTLEAIVHPLVRQAEEAFLAEAARAGAPFAVIDIPLLYETGGEKRCDFVVAVACTPQTQRARALRRPHMTAEKLDLILSRQLPIAEKAARADAVINSDETLEKMYAAVDDLLEWLNARFAH